MSSSVNQSSKNYPSTLPYEDSFEGPYSQSPSFQNGSHIEKNQILHSFPPPFANLLERQSSMSSEELDEHISFITNYLRTRENHLIFNFFDEALCHVNKNEIDKAKDVLRLHVAINKLKLFYFFHESDSNALILKIKDKLKDFTHLINFITSSIKESFNPSLSDTKYMPIYECLIALENTHFMCFFERCLYTQSFQKQKLKNDFKEEFCVKGFALQGHGMGFAKRGLRNLSNLILEEELRDTIHTGPIGKPDAISLKSFTCAAHGPFYLLVKANMNEFYSSKEHLAYIVPEIVDKELLIALMGIAFLRKIISEDQKKLNIARIFTMQEFLDLPEITLSSDLLEKYVKTKL